MGRILIDEFKIPALGSFADTNGVLGEAKHFICALSSFSILMGNILCTQVGVSSSTIRIEQTSLPDIII